MRRIAGFLLCSLVLLFLMASCTGGGAYFVDIGEQTEDTTYIIADNGLDTITFSSVDGTFELANFTFGYPDAAAVAEDNYILKEWFQTGGRRGTYSYDSETMELTLTTTEVYREIDGLTGGYKDSYNWLEYASSTDITADWAADYVSEEVFTAAFTQDNLLGAISDKIKSAADFFRSFGYDGIIMTGTVPYSYLTSMLSGYDLVYVAGADADTWEASVSRTYVNGTNITETFTYTISDTEITYDQTYTEVPRGGVASDTLHFKYTNESEVDQFFMQGSEAGTTFADAWKSGNIVTLFGTQLEENVMSYKASTPPSETPGTGNNTGFGSTYLVDTSPFVPFPGTLEPDGTYIVYQNLVDIPFSVVLGNQGTYLYYAYSNWAGRTLP